jgi:hypothetical protein
MFNYIFPIFAFGLVISGIVFLGLQQAADLAKALAEQRNQSERDLQKPGSPVPSSGGPPGKPPAT